MQPVKYDADGRVMVDSAGEIVSWANGMPFTADGSLAVSGSVPIAFTNGIPTDADNKLTVAQ